ncbi:hypothetical protein PV10_02021 [Exophiala mesophila]|uniref:Manganese/iron superoxide dismutase C-terminal domain-containing protein n=1 Tax=Exophiala mesophila TaxID=212818 RepID=A0A0D1ZJW5_EXOME|nr:uncharacterized protein PV10_02021 [Exophiala mesophila]KIV94234.1 hypothetical protein PV10_02021 [Exophiala mesophila]
MITRPLTRPQSLLRFAVNHTSCASRSQSQRWAHSVPEDWNQRKIPTFQNLKKPQVFAKYGVPGFLSKETFEQTYEQYIKYLADQLNEFTAGTADEFTSAADLHDQCSHLPARAALYNHAAMALHTQFFFESLSHIPTSMQPREPGILMQNNLKEDNISLEQLRTEFLETAEAMFGNGFVWLMKPKSLGGLTILATYNAGSPWSRGSPRRDNRDMANHDFRQITRDIQEGNQNAGAYGNHSHNRALHYEGTLQDAEPILCVNMWQHQWLPDYGMFGRKAYLKAWWDTIDWQVVENKISLFEINEGSRSRSNNITSVLETASRRQHSLR